MFFRFESDFVESLRCIPMQVRYKLDTCGIKLKLNHWHRLTSAERQSLIDRPCATDPQIQAYRDHLQTLVIHHWGQPASELPQPLESPWQDPDRVPDSVQDQAQTYHLSLTPQSWAQLSPLQRFALIKLSRSGHEHRNFGVALEEFDLIKPESIPPDGL